MHSSCDRIPQFFTILSLFASIALSEWTPDLRVAIIPLEPHSSAGNYATYAVESVNGSSSTSDHHHHHHYDRHPKYLATNAGADANDLFCLTEENRAYWTPLGEWSECSDSCGGCGIRWRPRECRRRHIQCDCLGFEKEEEACNLEVCIYPRKACCTGRTHTSIDGKFACERIDDETADYRN